MSSIQPRGERLRRAIRWLSEGGCHDAAAVADAARRFDLTPVEEQFLWNHFRDMSASGDEQ